MSRLAVFNPFELAALRAGLRAEMYDLGRAVRRNDAAGWIPEPGKLDLVRARHATAAALFAEVAAELNKRRPKKDLTEK